MGRRKAALLVGVVTLAIGGAAFVVSQRDDNGPSILANPRPVTTEQPPRVPYQTGGAAHDVEIDDCRADPATRRPLVAGVVRNSSSAVASYTISVEIRQGLRPVAEVQGVVNAVQPGQEAPWNAGIDETVHGDLICRVLTVERTPT